MKALIAVVVLGALAVAGSYGYDHYVRENDRKRVQAAQEEWDLRFREGRAKVKELKRQMELDAELEKYKMNLQEDLRRKLNP